MEMVCPSSHCRDPEGHGGGVAHDEFDGVHNDEDDVFQSSQYLACLATSHACLGDRGSPGREHSSCSSVEAHRA